MPFLPDLLGYLRPDTGFSVRSDHPRDLLQRFGGNTARISESPVWCPPDIRDGPELPNHSI